MKNRVLCFSKFIVIIILMVIIHVVAKEVSNKKGKDSMAQNEIFNFLRMLKKPVDDENNYSLYNKIFDASPQLIESHRQELLSFCIASLSLKNDAINHKASYILRFFTKQNFGYTIYASNSVKYRAIQKWEKWWVENKNKIQRNGNYWHKSTLILDEMGDKFYHLDSTDKEICKITTLQMPYDVAYLPKEDCYVMGLIRKRALYKVSKTGVTSNEIKVGGYPCGLQMLPNGNVLVAGWDDNVPGFVKEFDMQGKCIWKIEDLKWPWKAERLSNGNTLIAEAGLNKVFEVDKSGKEVWSVKDLGPANPSTFDNLGVVYCQRLLNGNTLVSIRGLHKVLELDPSGKTVWEVGKDILSYPYSAVRIWNGNTLIVDQKHSRVIELDINKKIVWEKKENYTYVAKAYRLFYEDETSLLQESNKDTSVVKKNKKIKNSSNFLATPNPARDNITFTYVDPDKSTIGAKLFVYDIVGNQVYTGSKNTSLDSTPFSIIWDCKNINGSAVEAGSYLAVLKTTIRSGNSMIYSRIIAIKK